MFIKLYKVQVGAYGVKSNAENMLSDLKSKGYDGFIVEEDVEETSLSSYIEVNNLKVIETAPDNIYVGSLPGKNLRQFGVYGINGTWQNNIEAHLTRSIWGLVANKNGAIGSNSFQNSPNASLNRGTVIYYKDGSLAIDRINNLSQIKKPILWAIGGGSLLPNIIDGEKFASDIFRRTKHTAIGIKNGRVFLIVSSVDCTMKEFQKLLLVLNLDGAIFLDGGGSSQMNYPGGKGLYSSRPLSHGVFLKGEII